MVVGKIDKKKPAGFFKTNLTKLAAICEEKDQKEGFFCVR